MTVAAQSYGGGSSSASSPVGAPTWFGGVLSAISAGTQELAYKGRPPGSALIFTQNHPGWTRAFVSHKT